MIPLLLPGFHFIDAQIPAEIFPEAFHHLTRVRRVKCGDKLLLSDGAGKRCTYTIQSIQKAFITLEAEVLCEEVQKPAVTLWMAVIDKSAMEEACHLVSQLGVAAIRFVQTDFTNVVWQEKHTARLQKIILASCTQSEQAWLPELEVHAEKLKELPWHEGVWHVAIERNREIVHEPSEGHIDRAVNVLIGPEGGWSQEERTYLASLIQASPRVFALDLGPSILRAQTAALVSCWSFTRQE